MSPGRMQILIVEDSLADYTLIRQMLSGLRDYATEVIHCVSLKEALDIIHNQHVDLILLDLILPDSTGKQTFDQVLKVSGETPVIILSGISDAQIALDAVKVGAQDYLVKGEFDEKLLLKSILYGLERKKNTGLLRQSRETYRLLFEENPIPILICDQFSSVIIRVNHSTSLRFGYPEAELKGKRWQQFLADDNDVELSPDSEQVHTFRFIRKNGDILYAECRSRELEYEGRPCLLILADDITERRKVQAEVMMQSNILSSVREPVVVFDRNGLITYWNEAAAETFEYSSGQTLGKSIDFLYPQIDKLRLPGELKEILSEKLVQWESKIITRSHKLIWVDNKVSLLKGEHGDVLGIIRILKDITKQRRSGEMLKESLVMLDSVFNNVIQGIVLMDEHFRISTFNATANRQASYLMGLEMSVGKSFLEYLNAEMHPDFLKRADRVATQKRENWEMAYAFSGGSKHWFDFSLMPVWDEHQNKLSSYCLSMIDITDRKLAEERFQNQYHEIESANQELDRVVKILSHDLRAPMNSISGLITLARDEKDQQEFANYLNMMEKSVQKLDKFTSDIIQSLKNRATGKNLTELNLSSLIQELFDELKYAPNATEVELLHKVPADLTIKTDALQLRIILSNLISNAAKYHDPHKPNPYVLIQSIVENGYLLILAEDNGIGIAAEHLNRIFEPHYTVAPSNEQSKGIGLANVQNAVHQLGGTIHVQSTPGTGSTFRIRLPMS